MRILTIATLTIAAYSILGAAGAQAETYDGVHTLGTLASRSAVQAGAVIAAHGTNPYAEGAAAGLPVTATSLRPRAQARADAIAAARAGNIYGDGAGAGADGNFASTLDRAAVHAQAVAVAHGVGGLGL